MRTKFSKRVSQVSCPIQLNGIDCGLFAVVICLHIFEGTKIGPHIFTQYEISKLRTLLPRLLVKDRNERYHGIHAFLEPDGTTAGRAMLSRCYPIISIGWG